MDCRSEACSDTQSYAFADATATSDRVLSSLAMGLFDSSYRNPNDMIVIVIEDIVCRNTIGSYRSRTQLVLRPAQKRHRRRSDGR